MSRFIQYASNLLDGVDSIAKGSLTDQGEGRELKMTACAEQIRCTGATLWDNLNFSCKLATQFQSLS